MIHWFEIGTTDNYNITFGAMLKEKDTLLTMEVTGPRDGDIAFLVIPNDALSFLQKHFNQLIEDVQSYG